MIRTAIIGVTGYGGVHLEMLMEYLKKGILEIKAAVVINQDEVPEVCSELRELGCTIYQDYRIMLEKEAGNLDLCCIPTGIAWHTPMTLAALEAGANVLVEKPLAGTIQEVRQIQEKEKETGKFVAVGFQDTYRKGLHALKREIIEGKFGKLQTIKVRCLWGRNSVYYNRNNWAGRLKTDMGWVLDSPVNNAMAHFVNFSLFLASREENETAKIKSVEAELYRTRDIESFDTAGIRIKTDQDVEILFLGSHSCEEHAGPYVRIECENRSVSWQYDKKWEIFDGEKLERTIEEVDPMQNRILMMGDVLEKVHNVEQFVCGTEIAAAHTLCVNAIHDHFVISQIDSEHLQKRDNKSAEAIWINEIDTISEKAFDDNKLFSEIEVPWAQKPQTVELNGYNQFLGKLIEIGA